MSDVKILIDSMIVGYWPICCDQGPAGRHAGNKWSAMKIDCPSLMTDDVVGQGLEMGERKSSVTQYTIIMRR